MTLESDKDHVTRLGVHFNLPEVGGVPLVSGQILGDLFITELDDVPALCVHLLDPCRVHHDPPVEFSFLQKWWLVECLAIGVCGERHG